VRTFASLLSEFVERAGIPDADLARRMGVSRQTVFRWREGTTRAPRRREDILSLARWLRLDTREREELLLSAGFAPEGVPVALPSHSAEQADDPGLEYGRSDHDSTLRRAPRSLGAPPGLPARFLRMPPRRRAVLLLVAVLLVVVLPWGLWLTARPSLTAGREAWPDPAGPGETLVLVSEFANYGGTQAGYNVAGRLREALRAALDSADLVNVRVEEWPETLKDQTAATQRAERSGAAAVVWGEYDSGRVVARVSTNPSGPAIHGSEQRWILAEPSQLNTTVNSDLPENAQWMALYVLGQVSYWTERPEQAEAAFRQALASPPEDPSAMATAYSYMAALEARKAEPDLDLILADYTEALRRQPNMTPALNNRGVAYLRRDAPGDIQRAEADFRQAMSQDPSFAPAPFNLALSLLRNPANDAAEALQLLRTAETLDPSSPGVHNALCWTLSLEGRPSEAMPSCDKAVKLDVTGYAYDSRALALALLGRFEDAIGDFERFLELTRERDPRAYARYAPTRQDWLAALGRGENPFTPQALELLREAER